MGINFKKGGTFLCRLCYEALTKLCCCHKLTKGVTLVLESESGSESNDFIQVDTEESSTDGSNSDFDNSDSHTSIFNLMIQNVVQNITSYRQCKEANRHF